MDKLLCMMLFCLALIFAACGPSVGARRDPDPSLASTPAELQRQQRRNDARTKCVKSGLGTLQECHHATQGIQ